MIKIKGNFFFEIISIIVVNLFFCLFYHPWPIMFCNEADFPT